MQINETIKTEFITTLDNPFSGEELIKEAEKFINFGTWQINTTNGTFEWSDQMCRIYGYDPSGFKPSADTFLSHIHPQDAAAAKANLFKTNSSDGFEQLNFRITDKKGIIKSICARYFSNVNSKGDVIKISGLAWDVTKQKAEELQLKESHALYQVIIGNSMSAFFVSNIKGDILDTNDAASSLFGYTKEELKKISRKQILDEEDPKFIHALQHRKRTGHMKGEVAGFKKNGEQILLEYTSTQFLDVNNEEKVISSMVDITSRKQQEEILLKSNERFEHVSKATFDAIWDWDVNSRQLYFGDGFTELFGYHLVNNTGDFSTWYNHIYPEDKERVILSRLNKIIHHKESTWKDEYRYIRADGSVAYICDRGILLRNSTGTYRMIGAMQDVTELKENEFAISNLNKSLEKRAAELAISNEDLERFAYVASHDLQEPLRMVSSFLQLLQQKYDQQLDDTAQKYINYAVDGADRMKTLILDLLEYSRISSDKKNHTILDLNEIINQTLQVLKPLIDESEALVSVEPYPQICGNSSQLIRLFQNLISNALKYRSALKPVIQIGCTEKDTELEFFIKDNGIGIQAKYFEKIFIIFQRLHSRTEFSGTGIGLAICKKIVDLHGGRIWVESTLHQGSIFYFTVSKISMSKPPVW